MNVSTIPIGRKYEAKAQKIPIKINNHIEGLFLITNIIRMLAQRKKANG